jgi:rhodanese-related sulfurtransferase
MLTIHASALHRRQQEGPVQLVDVRSPAEFERGHVPGAINVPLDQLSRRSLVAIDLGQPVYLVCKSGGRSQMAVHRLHADGVEGLVNVVGGTDGWIALGLPLEHGPVTR